MPVPLPDHAVRRPISLETARQLGLTRHELSGPLWQQLGRGVRGWCGLDERDPMTRIGAVATQLPEGVAIGGWAALHMHGVHDLDGRSGPGGRELPVLVHSGPRSRVRPRPGIVVDRSALSAADLGDVGGTLVTSPVRACFDIMRRDGVEEGLVAGDAAGRMIALAPEEVRSYVGAHPCVPGVPRARTCAMLLDPRAASNPESRLRNVWSVEAGLPRPLVNATVVDEWGRLLGMPDLLDDAPVSSSSTTAPTTGRSPSTPPTTPAKSASRGPGSSWFARQQWISGLDARSWSGGFATATPAGWPATGRRTGGRFGYESHQDRS